MNNFENTFQIVDLDHESPNVSFNPNASIQVQNNQSVDFLKKDQMMIPESPDDTLRKIVNFMDEEMPDSQMLTFNNILTLQTNLGTLTILG